MKSPWLTVCVVAAVAFLWLAQAKPDEPNRTPTSSADPMRGKEAGEIRDDNGLKMKLVWCPPGFFTMENAEGITEPAVEKDDGQNDDACGSGAGTRTSKSCQAAAIWRPEDTSFRMPPLRGISQENHISFSPIHFIDPQGIMETAQSFRGPEVEPHSLPCFTTGVTKRGPR